MAKGKSETPSKGHSQKGEQRGHEHFEKGSKSERLNEGKLPDNRGDLFRRFVIGLLKKERDRHLLKESEFEPILTELTQLAAQMQSSADENGEARTVLVWRGASTIVAASYPQADLVNVGASPASRAVIVRIMQSALFDMAPAVIGQRADPKVQRVQIAELQDSLRRGKAADVIRW